MNSKQAEKHYEDWVKSRNDVYKKNQEFLDKNPFKTEAKTPKAITLDNKKLDPKAEALWRQIFVDDGSTKANQPTRNLGECASIATNLTGVTTKSKNWLMGPSATDPKATIVPGTAMATFDKKTGTYSMNSKGDGHTVVFISRTEDSVKVLEQFNFGHGSGGMPRIRDLPIVQEPRPGETPNWSNVANYFHVYINEKMKVPRLNYLLLFYVLALGPCSARDARPAMHDRSLHSTKEAELYRPKNYKTGAELLLGVNLWMSKFRLPLLEYDDLIVRLANHASFSRSGDDLNLRSQAFLKALVKKRSFPDPVELEEWCLDDIPLTSDYAHGERLPVPKYCVLELHILNLPRGSVDHAGTTQKLSWSTIVIDDVKERKKGAQGPTPIRRSRGAPPAQ